MPPRLDSIRERKVRPMNLNRRFHHAAQSTCELSSPCHRPTFARARAGSYASCLHKRRSEHFSRHAAALRSCCQLMAASVPRARTQERARTPAAAPSAEVSTSHATRLRSAPAFNECLPASPCVAHEPSGTRQPLQPSDIISHHCAIACST